MGSHAVAFTSSVLRGADATLKGDKNLESYSGFNKDWDDYTAWLFSHVDSRGLLLFFNHALHERIAIVSDGSVEERSLYTQVGAVARRVLVVVVDVQARRAPSSARDIDARSSQSDPQSKEEQSIFIIKNSQEFSDGTAPRTTPGLV